MPRIQHASTQMICLHFKTEAVAQYMKDCDIKRSYQCYYRLRVAEGYRWMHHFGNIDTPKNKASNGRSRLRPRCS